MDSEQNQSPILPPEVPNVSAAPLWTSLLVPPLATATSGLLIGFIGDHKIQESFYLSIPLLSAAFILGFLFQFSFTVGRRYQGASFAFLVFAYIFGQIIICLTLWIGSCFYILVNNDLK
jgi:hypothetical protein